jgi:hypothetical protein
MQRTALMTQMTQLVAGMSADRRERLEAQLHGGWPAQTYVAVQSPRHCEEIEGVVIAGEPLPDGGWDLDSDFVVLSPDGDRFKVVGHVCDITILTDDDEEEEWSACD